MPCWPGLFCVAPHGDAERSNKIKAEGGSASPKENSFRIPPEPNREGHTTMTQTSTTQQTTANNISATPIKSDNLYDFTGTITDIVRGTSKGANPKPYFKAILATTLRGKPANRRLMGFGKGLENVNHLLVEGATVSLTCKFERAPNGGEMLTTVAAAPTPAEREARKAARVEGERQAA